MVCGFEWGISSATVADVEARLRLVDVEQRGFAYEGATMAFTILDTVRGHRTRELMSGSGAPHIFLSYIGIGFAIARLPRPLWKKVLPELSDIRYHPVMSWLAVDGYGFDRAYFDTEKWVDQQFVPPSYPWEGNRGYFLRVVDQGIGRALWFIHGGDPVAVAAAVQRFGASRQPDLWSGVGLAATFAGGCPADGLAELRVAAAEHRDELALGSIFAAKARTFAGHVPAHTVVGMHNLAQLSIEEAVALADATEPAEDRHDGELAAYELWRSSIRRECGSRLASVDR